MIRSFMQLMLGFFPLVERSVILKKYTCHLVLFSSHLIVVVKHLTSMETFFSKLWNLGVLFF